MSRPKGSKNKNKIPLEERSPMTNDDPIEQELSELAEFRNEVYKATGQLAQAASEALTFEERGVVTADYEIDDDGSDACNVRKSQPISHGFFSHGFFVKTGILWIPPFLSLDWVPKRTKAVKPKCVCPACGSKHTQKYITQVNHD